MRGSDQKDRHFEVPAEAQRIKIVDRTRSLGRLRAHAENAMKLEIESKMREPWAPYPKLVAEADEAEVAIVPLRDELVVARRGVSERACAPNQGSARRDVVER